MTNSKHPSLDVTAANGVPFRVVLLPDGKSDNFPYSGSWRSTEPLVEFYDARYRNVRGFTPDGQFISRYYLETLLTRGACRGEGYGLDLQGDVPNWTIDATTMRTVAIWLDTHTIPLRARTWDEEAEDRRELVRHALREVLPNHYIARGDMQISLEAASDLLDIIDGLKSDVARLQAFLPPIDESSVDL
jgi:hypothetical protein